MTKRIALLKSLAKIIADYRRGELAAPTPEHVDRWVSQFEGSAQVAILSELSHVLRCTYFSRQKVEKFLSSLISTEELVGSDPCRYWRGANLLDIQRDGNSQKDMLSIFVGLLEGKCATLTPGTKGSDFIYLDDAIFSGSRLRNDLIPWIQSEAPEEARVHVVSLAIYTGSEWAIRVPIAGAIKDSGKKISIRRWRAIELENQRANKDRSEVLWPAEIPDDSLVKAYVESQDKYPFAPRVPRLDAVPACFSSEEGRQTLESQFLAAGVKIRGFCSDPKAILKPLGFSLFGLGFGSTIVTYRNCPNNAPLALWWGDPDADESHPFSKWYPLFPRKTYAQNVDFDAIEF